MSHDDRSSGRLLDVVLDRAPDPLVVLHGDGRVLTSNHAAEVALGWSAAELVGRHAGEVLATDPDAFVAGIAEALAAGEWTGELTLRTRSNRQVAVEAWATREADPDDAGPAVLLALVDVDDRRRRAELVERAQRMEALGSLAAGVAHDMNNVLTPISTAVQILLGDEQDPHRVSLLQAIEQAADRGIDTMARIRALSGATSSDTELVDLADVVDELVPTCRATFGKHIRIEVSVDPAVRPVRGDRSQLRQVLLNLCINARDAMPSGGTVRIVLEDVELDDTFAAALPRLRPGPHVRLEVRDTGSGMTRDVVQRAFEPFYTTRAGGTGTGLGLSTADAIVRAHGGLVQADSTIGVGTTMSVLLPSAGSEDHATDSDSTGSTNAPDGDVVLLVEDEALVREVTAQALTDHGYRVLQAGDGAEGVSLFARHREEVAVVVVDLLMPVMDGPRTIHALRRLRPHVPIVATSGALDDDRAAAARRAGVDSFVSKPYARDRLVAVLADVLRVPA